MDPTFDDDLDEAARLRREIEQTRARLADRVDTLTARFDVPARLRGSDAVTLTTGAARLAWRLTWGTATLAGDLLRHASTAAARVARRHLPVRPLEGIVSDFMNKAKEFADKHDDKVDEGLEKAGDQASQRTGGKYDNQIDKGVDTAQERTGSGDTRK